MSTLICGSIAYDTIMVFHDRFKNHILPEKIQILNVAFLVPDMRREFGGCAGNIAYTLKMLGGEPLVMATVGEDAAPYASRMDALGLSRRHVREVPGSYTAQAFITTDLADNQITAFHPGAMGRAHEVAAPTTAAWGIVAPNGKDAMLRHAREFTTAGIPWIFDPGQALPMFSGDELRALVGDARALAVNDYECRLMCEKTGLPEAELAARVDAMIVTRGGDGSVLHEAGRTETIAPVRVQDPVDPTGCGDAYRGGLLFALAGGASWSQAARLGSVMGAIKIAHAGPQNHPVNRDDVARRFRDAYGTSAW